MTKNQITSVSNNPPIAQATVPIPLIVKLPQAMREKSTVKKNEVKNEKGGAMYFLP